MKREDNEFAKTGKGISYAGFLTIALGLLFTSAFLWTDETASPAKSIAVGILCIIAGMLLILRDTDYNSFECDLEVYCKSAKTGFKYLKIQN